MRETEPHFAVRPRSRNTAESARGVVPIRLSDSERKRIGRAAAARDLPFSSFVRWAALEAASDQLLRAARGAKAARPEQPARRADGPVLIDPEPVPGHFVEGVLVTGSLREAG